MSRSIVARAFGAVALALVSASALAQGTYPARAVKVIVPYPAGGSLDTITRLVSEHLSGKWAQPVVVENRAGASGMIGTDAVAKAAPDGHTILFSASSEVGMNVALFPQMAYDPTQDLAPVTLLARTPPALLVHPSLSAQTLGEVLDLARQSPGKIAFATPGIATPQHFAVELLRMRAGVDITHVPYKGAAPLINDLVAGHVKVGLLALPSVMPHIKAGKMRAVALTAGQRSSLLPQLPTIAESGVPQFDVGQWLAVFVPGATPTDIVRRLNADIVAFVKTPAFGQRMQDLGADVVGSSPEELRKTQLADIATYRSIAGAAKIKAE